MDHTTSRHESGPPSFWGSRFSIGFFVLGAIATYFLLSEHRAHFIGALPWLLLLACPLMHVFMHGRHGRHGGHGGHGSGHAGHEAARPKTGDQP